VNKEYLKIHGLKVTLPRLQILHIFENSPKPHLSAEAIYQELLKTEKEVSMATVYRVLTQFEAAGLITRHHFEENHAVYEINQGGHHDHLVCLKCNRVEEFVDEQIEIRQQEIATAKHFKMTNHSLNIYGICKQCQG
jgi:Fur family transcriptional regulator, ferric uptake regulator